jgi:hypothetical protein
VKWIRDRLLEEMDAYALIKAPCLRKLRESKGGVPYERQVYSLLISYGDVPAQSLNIDMAYPLYQGVLLLLTPSPPTQVFSLQNDLHIDMAYPLYQGVLLLLTPSPPTQVFSLQNDLDVSKALHIDMAYPLYQGVLLLTPSPSTHALPHQHALNTSKADKLEVKDFADLLCRRLSSPISDDAQADVVQAIRSDVDAVELVEKYGSLFAPTVATLRAHRKATEQLPGQGRAPICAFPGSVIHRGPALRQVPDGAARVVRPRI